jgi:hypothetical protein
MLPQRHRPAILRPVAKRGGQLAPGAKEKLVEIEAKGSSRPKRDIHTIGIWLFEEDRSGGFIR